MRAARSGCAPVSCASEAGWREVDRAGHASTVLAPMASPATIEADLAVVGAGAAGLYAALTAARAGARVALVSRDARWPSRRATGRRAGWPPRSRSTTRASSTSRTRCAPGAARSGAARPRCCASEAPAAVRDLERLGVRFDADRSGRLSLGLEGGHSVRRDRARRRRRDRAARRRASCPRSSPSTSGSRCCEDCRAVALPTTTGRCAGVRLRRRARRAGPRRRARHRRRRRAVVAHDQPARARSAPGCCSRTPPAPRSPTWRSMQFHPTAVAGVKRRRRASS